MRLTLLIFALLLHGLAYGQYPNRVKLEPADQQAANPKPVARAFRANNQAHRILVGVLGSGIDYNHPALLKQIHFDLNPQGVPEGAGLDFVGDDRWASPRIVDTSHYSFSELDPDSQARILREKTEEEYNLEQASAFTKRACVLKQIQSRAPELAKYDSLHRSSANEEGAGSESTWVASMIAQKNPAIGLVPYRTRPYAPTESQTKADADGSLSVELDLFEKVLADAVREKIRILYVPNFNVVTQADDRKSVSTLEDERLFQLKKKLIVDRYEQLISSHPDMLFITAPNAERGWSDQETIYQAPCGLPEPNLLCVVPLTEQGAVDPGVAVPLNQDAHVIYLHAQAEETTRLSDRCEGLDELVARWVAGTSILGEVCKSGEKSTWLPLPRITVAQAAILASVSKTCRARAQLSTSTEDISSTFLASAELTHQAAMEWIAHPELATGADLVSRLMSLSDCSVTKNWVMRCELKVR